MENVHWKHEITEIELRKAIRTVDVIPITSPNIRRKINREAEKYIQSNKEKTTRTIGTLYYCQYQERYMNQFEKGITTRKPA